MRVGVGDAIKDRVMFEQSLKPIDIHRHRQHEQQKRNRDGESAPGGRGHS